MMGKKFFQVCASLLMLACFATASFASTLVEAGRFAASNNLLECLRGVCVADMNGDGWKEWVEDNQGVWVTDLRTGERITPPVQAHGLWALTDIDGNGRAEMLIAWPLPAEGSVDSFTVFRWTNTGTVSADPPGPSQDVSIGVLPNPSNAQMGVILSGAKGQTLTLDVYDVNGRKVASIFRGEVANPIQRFDWVPSLPSGVYFLCATGDRFEVVSRAVLVR